MEPIPATVEAFDELDPGVGAPDLLDRLRRLAARAQQLVPDLIGVSLTQAEEELTFTLVASAKEVAVLDAVQYAVGGPCVQGSRTGHALELDNDDVLDEERWRVFAQATAAHAVRSTLTLPVLAGDTVVGSVNLYAASGRAFDGHHEALTELFGAWAAGAISNADLPFSTRREAEAAPGRVRDQVLVEVAVGIVAADLDVEPEAAEAHLRAAATRAGVRLSELARDLVRGRRGDDRGEA